MKKLICEKGFTSVELIMSLMMSLMMIIGAWGWTWNIIKIVGSDFDPLAGMVILRCIGVFVVPLGVVLGFL